MPNSYDILIQNYLSNIARGDTSNMKTRSIRCPHCRAKIKGDRLATSDSHCPSLEVMTRLSHQHYRKIQQEEL